MSSKQHKRYRQALREARNRGASIKALAKQFLVEQINGTRLRQPRAFSRACEAAGVEMGNYLINNKVIGHDPGGQPRYARAETRERRPINMQDISKEEARGHRIVTE